MFGGQKFLGAKEFWVLKNWVKSNNITRRTTTSERNKFLQVVASFK